MPSRNGHRYLEQDWGSTGEIEVPSMARPTDLDRRSTHRVALQARVTYVHEADLSSYGEGLLIDLSKEGCRIGGSRAVVIGSTVRLSINFSDGHPPLCLCAATVCWREGNTFGVKFAELTENERQRLQQLIWKFASRKGESGEHTGFRFA
jgi:PilZ domain